MQKNTTATTLLIPNEIKQKFQTKISGTSFWEIVLKETERALFGVHEYLDLENPNYAGFYIREEIGISDSVLPKSYKGQRFDSLDEARSFCLHHLIEFTKLLNSESANKVST